MKEADAEFSGVAADSEFAHYVLERETSDEGLWHKREDADDLGLAFHSGEVHHSAAGGKNAVVRAAREQDMAGEVIIFVPAGDDLFGGWQGGVNEDEGGVVFKESTAVKAIEWGTEDFDGVSLTSGKEVGQGKAFRSKPWDAVGIVLDEEAAHNIIGGRARLKPGAGSNRARPNSRRYFFFSF